VAPLKQLWAREVGEDVARYFPFAYHRLALGILLVFTLIAQTVLSVNAVRPDELIAQQLLANESDANSVVAVQRESFNVAILLSDWGHGAASARDVQIARALLGQRLAVVTRSSTTTAANVGEEYLTALSALDLVIRGLGDVPPEHAEHALADAEGVLEEFLTQTRALTEIFQRLGRQQIETLEATNRSGQLAQTGLQFAIVLLVALLSISIVLALGRGYRQVVADLASERSRVEIARRNLDLVRDLDAGIAPLLQAVDAGAPTVVVRHELRVLLERLPTGWVWEVPAGPEAVVIPASSIEGSRVILDADERDMVVHRAQAVLDALRRRDGAVRTMEVARRRDPLTGLCNRLGLVEALEGLLLEDHDRSSMVCFLDIDRFGEVNGALGFAGADRVLIELAGRLQDALSGTDGAVVARVAADEFAVVAPLASDRDATLVVDALRAAGTYVSHVGGMEAVISVTSGEAIGAGRDHDGPELMRRAAIAMLLAKESGDRRGHVRFDQAQHDHLSSALVEQVAVRNALRAGEFTMHYQPIVELETGRPVGIEALARWERPGVGLVLPGEFLPTIERTGYAVEFGLETLVEVMSTWQRSLRRAVVGIAGSNAYVSVNVDAAQLADPGFEPFVVSNLARIGMDPRELVLELTEHAAIDRSHAPMLERLRAAGVRIAIDDFGSGYSSLGQSAQLPVDVLKLDRSFVFGLLDSDHDTGLFADVARIAQTLGVALIAEGVETQEVAQLLSLAGIHTGQGFLFSRALPEQDLVRWVSVQGSMQGVSEERTALTVMQRRSG
jgi:diguanylate cyclase (GGDEF)-like protein